MHWLALIRLTGLSLAVSSKQGPASGRPSSLPTRSSATVVSVVMMALRPASQSPPLWTSHLRRLVSQASPPPGPLLLLFPALLSPPPLTLSSHHPSITLPSAHPLLQLLRLRLPARP